MSNADSAQPDDVERLKALVLEQAERNGNARLTAYNTRYQARILTAAFVERLQLIH